MQALIIGVWITQGLFMFFDEFIFHHKRGLKRWEIIGHPIDSLFFLAPFVYTQFFENDFIFIGLCVFSSLLITKDEFVHQQECNAAEQWLHSLLFLIHPVALFALWFAWKNEWNLIIQIQASVIFFFMLYQIIYWNLKKDLNMKPKVNNDYYNHLGESWYSADDDPIAVLRVEQLAKNPWVEEKIKSHYKSSDLKIADVGCGAGFLTNYLALHFNYVFGIDASESSLEVAKSKDTTQAVHYVVGDAYHLPYEDSSMDVVCAMDFLEHVERPQDVIAECARILRPGGLFFFHTFNRNFLSWLIVIKFMEWFVPNTPKNLHVLHLFIKPEELQAMMKIHQLTTQELTGLGPRFNWGFLRSAFARKIRPGFSFKIGGPTLLGYIGYATKEGLD